MSIPKQDIINAFWFRHACKEFDVSRPVSREDFDFILETARLSPSSFGLEHWKFLVIQNPALRERLREHVWGAQLQLPTASHFVVALFRKAAVMRFDSEYVQNFLRQVQNLSEQACQIRTSILEKFQADDFRLLDSENTMNCWSARQTYLPLANMMTAAALIGVDSCPIEGFDHEQVERLLTEALELDMSAWGLAYMVAFGYRKTNPKWAKTRQPLAAIVDWVE